MSLAHNLGRQLREYSDWRQSLIVSLGNYQAWREQQEFNSAEDDLCIYELIESLKSDKLTVALAAEYSRGKTELINAIFFSDYKQRLLPSNAGRTTMCPTELQYDPEQPPGIHLLPIETRSSALTIAEYKHLRTHWSKFSLPVQNARKMAAVLQEIVKTKTVTLREAEELGLYAPHMETHDSIVHADGTIDIPVWRHAIINYPHPLLAQGLVIIDTPGLNALGTEPELTMNLLNKAQATLFVLSADTGVTKTDYEVWGYISRYKKNPGSGLIAVLNKIDVLWDQLHSNQSIKQAIVKQIKSTAKTLGIPTGQVLPVSAQKGLIGKIKNDNVMLKKSGLLALEEKLSREMIPGKQALIRDKVVRDMESIFETTNAMINTRVEATSHQLEELKGLVGKNSKTVRATAEKMVLEKQAYEKTLSEFKGTQVLLNKQIEILLDMLSLKHFDALVEKTRQELQGSWTTAGLRVGMKTFFRGLEKTSGQVNKQVQHIKRMVQSIYNNFHLEYGLSKIKPSNFDVMRYYGMLNELQQDIEAYRKSPMMLVSEQHFVIKRFFITLASQARVIVSQWEAGATMWSKAISQPITAQIHEHKLNMERQISTLYQVKSNLSGLQDEIKRLEENKRDLRKQKKIAELLLQQINRPLPSTTTNTIAENRVSV